MLPILIIAAVALAAVAFSSGGDSGTGKTVKMSSVLDAAGTWPVFDADQARAEGALSFDPTATAQASQIPPGAYVAYAPAGVTPSPQDAAMWSQFTKSYQGIVNAWLRTQPAPVYVSDAIPVTSSQGAGTILIFAAAPLKGYSLVQSG